MRQQWWTARADTRYLQALSGAATMSVKQIERDRVGSPRRPVRAFHTGRPALQPRLAQASVAAAVELLFDSWKHPATP